MAVPIGNEHIKAMTFQTQVKFNHIKTSSYSTDSFRIIFSLFSHRKKIVFYFLIQTKFLNIFMPNLFSYFGKAKLFSYFCGYSKRRMKMLHNLIEFAWDKWIMTMFAWSRWFSCKNYCWPILREWICSNHLACIISLQDSHHAKHV